MPEKKLPKFKTPPVTEVLCCVYFQDLTELHAPHLGDLWRALGDDYVRIQTVAPLPPINFSLASLSSLLTQGIEGIQSDQFQLPRTWFINSDDTSLIQVQRDRFVFNWKQNHNQNPYPSYDVVIAAFRKILGIFMKFVDTAKIGKLTLNGIELAYVNHFLFERELTNLSSIESVLPFFSWHANSNPAFKTISAINWHTQFEMPDGDGHLHFTVQTTQRRRDGQALVRADFVTRKLAPEIPFNSIWNWFDKGHECIVTSFADVTGGDVQRDVWKRYQ